ncbi:DNA polymerase Y family protein [Pseudaminobacter arsenicus]|uniref:DNA polymerase Y family protein n=1 Tax=Borborobacter arsenicus TaxID=1851146 RepID=A0A432V2D5_9HYPH|nr:DNA polymerase Y family protein [Pseudaminobacter arsenicus]
MSTSSQTDGSKLSRRRIMALWFPYLSTERTLRQRLGPSWRSAPAAARPPLLISHREKNTQRIAALDAQAERLGLKPGMGIADARAMHPAIEIVEADPAADRRLLEILADWCDRYTPLVAFDGTDGLFLDITGCAHLLGGEKPLLDDLHARFFRQGFDVRAGLASTPGAAWAAAHFLGNRIVAEGGEQGLLAALPLAALRLDPATRSELESVGLRLVGMLMQAPRAPLARRFGKTLLIRLDQALGQLEETISPRLPVAPLSVERQLAEPILLMEGIESLTLLLARSLKADLERRNEGARILQLLLFRVDGMVSRITVSTSRPLREPHLIGRLFHEKLAAMEHGLDAGCGFDLIRLSVLSSVPFEGQQADLASSMEDKSEDLALFADRVRARHGDRAIMRCQPAESHIPERAVSFMPFTEAGGKAEILAARMPARSPRPIRLFAHPEPVEVIAAEIPEGPPARFRWRRALYEVARAEGPERIAPEWWRAGPEEATRDYFHVEDADGRRYWLFRQGLYGARQGNPRWFMQGLFA